MVSSILLGSRQNLVYPRGRMRGLLTGELILSIMYIIIEESIATSLQNILAHAHPEVNMCHCVHL